ncbi:MAG: NAD(P)/FAD-dependent oxidoreductase, partial [Geminicoccaceae bacterium]|nr:NAD(P)/FAD-dependent oxidoreductase [Geminicoccaceae bacterium]
MRTEPFDVVVVGGAFSGAATALLLRRRLPDARIAVVEKRERFDRKVGEATVELSAYFLHHVLGLHDYLSREHLPKHGLRFWFTDGPGRRLDEMTEIGPREVPALPAFQLDRAKLDEHLLALAREAGCTVLRPARVESVETGWPSTTVVVREDGKEPRTLEARWLVDGTGREGWLASRLGLRRPLPQHPTAAAWGRWRNINDMDGPLLRGPDPRHPRLGHVAPARRLATNHFCGDGWWCWVIPLKGGETSIGVVFDRRRFDLFKEGKARAAYERFVRGRPGLAELAAGADLDGDDFAYRRSLPYTCERYMEKGWALVGDAATFLDPFYSPGLDHAAVSICATAEIVEADLGGLPEPDLDARVASHNAVFARSIPRWLDALYTDKYELFGDAELVRCAYLVDTGLYLLGVVGPAHRTFAAMSNPIFGPDLPQSRIAAGFMRFFKSRLVQIARHRRQTGTYGRRNAGWRSYGPAFDLGARSAGNLRRGLQAWLALETEHASRPLRGAFFLLFSSVGRA